MKVLGHAVMGELAFFENSYRASQSPLGPLRSNSMFVCFHDKLAGWSISLLHYVQRSDIVAGMLASSVCWHRSRQRGSNCMLVGQHNEGIKRWLLTSFSYIVNWHILLRFALRAELAACKDWCVVKHSCWIIRFHLLQVGFVTYCSLQCCAARRIIFLWSCTTSVHRVLACAPHAWLYMPKKLWNQTEAEKHHSFFRFWRSKSLA